MKKNEMIAAIVDAAKKNLFKTEIEDIDLLEYLYTDENGEESAFEDRFDYIDTTTLPVSVWFITGEVGKDINVPIGKLTEQSLQRLYNCIGRDDVFDGTLAVSFEYNGKRYQEVIIPEAAESDPDIEDVWHYPIESHDDGIFMRLFGSYGDDDELLTSGLLQVRVQNTHTGEEEYIDDVDVIGADEVDNYPTIYDEISDVCNRINQYCGYAKMTGEETDAVSLKLMDKMQDLSSQLNEVAKELLDHKAWD